MVVDAGWELLIEQYHAGVSLDVLAAGARMNRSTLTLRLKERGAFIDGRKNKATNVLCQRGHDLAVHGKQTMKTMPSGKQVKNGRECTECKRERARV